MKVGDHVGNDTIVCVIEAMKVFNEIPAEQTGKIVAVLVQKRLAGRIRPAALSRSIRRAKALGGVSVVRCPLSVATVACAAANCPRLRIATDQ